MNFKPSKQSLLSIHVSFPQGFSLQNTAIYILNEQLVPVKMGELGEIFISGYNLCTGYVGIPDSDKFLPIPTMDSKGIYILIKV